MEVKLIRLLVEYIFILGLELIKIEEILVSFEVILIAELQFYSRQIFFEFLVFEYTWQS